LRTLSGDADALIRMASMATVPNCLSPSFRANFTIWMKLSLIARPLKP
jgi:hypothetical protein